MKPIQSSVVVLALSFLTLLPGCRDKSPSKSTPSPNALSKQEPIARQKALALADSRGSSELDQTLLLLRRAAEKNPRKVDLWVNLGRTWITKARVASDPGFYLHADAACDVALSIEPDQKQALALKTLVLLNEHKFVEARTLAETVVAKHPEEALAHGSLSDAHLELGDIDRAAEEAQRMLDIKPSLPSYGRAAYLAWLKGERAHAKELARLAIDSGGGKDTEPVAWQLSETAKIFWQEGDYEGADVGYDAALEVFPEYPHALAGKGRAALSRGDAHAAVGLLKRAYAKSPLVEIGWLLADAEELDGAAQDAQATRVKLEADGRMHDARTLASFWATKNVHTDEAIELARAELERRPGIYTHDALAWALYRQGRFAEAKVHIEQATKHGTPDAKLLYHAGAIAIASGQAKEGRALVKRALALNPKFDVFASREAASLLSTSPQS
jgi:tetratricopeptide (TPR) repeat protein